MDSAYQVNICCDEKGVDKMVRGARLPSASIPCRFVGKQNYTIRIGRTRRWHTSHIMRREQYQLFINKLLFSTLARHSQHEHEHLSRLITRLFIQCCYSISNVIMLIRKQFVEGSYQYCLLDSFWSLSVCNMRMRNIATHKIEHQWPDKMA